MLVLSRRIDERVVLPEIGVSIAVLGIHGKRVRIGIQAPQGTSVHRQEVWERILNLTTPDLDDEPVTECSATLDTTPFLVPVASRTELRIKATDTRSGSDCSDAVTE